MADAAIAVTRPAKFFRYARTMLIALVAAGILLAIGLFVTAKDADAGIPVLFFGGVYIALAVPACVGCTVLAALSLIKGENHRAGAWVILIVMSTVAWTFRAVPFSFAHALIEGYLQRPWP